jgi:hypothetical protein
VPELELGAGDDQQVAQIVGVHGRRILLKGSRIVIIRRTPTY